MINVAFATSTPVLPSQVSCNSDREFFAQVKYRHRCTVRAHVKCSVSTRESETGLPTIAPTKIPGTTGILAANLWPIPVLGEYGWALFVWRRNDLKNLCVEVAFNKKQDPDHFAISFASTSHSSYLPSSSEHHDHIRGIVTGDFNVRDALRSLPGTDDKENGYCLTIPHRPNDFVLSQQCFVSSDARLTQEAGVSRNMWSSNSLVFMGDDEMTETMSSEFRVLKIFEDKIVTNRKTFFQYFEMNLKPIPVLGKHSAFVAVYKQMLPGTDVVAIDKQEHHIGLRVIGWRRDDKIDLKGSQCLGRVAVKEFFGTVSDSKATSLHESLLAGMRSAGLKVKSESDYRIVMDNTPKVGMRRRKNELHIELADS